MRYRFLHGLSGVTANDLFTPAEIAILIHEWPTIRVAARFDDLGGDVGWKQAGYPGIPFSLNSQAILRQQWSGIREAAQFTDIKDVQWYIPAELMPKPAALPVPEISKLIPTRKITPEAAPAALNPKMDTSAQTIPNWWESILNTPVKTMPAAQKVPDILAPGSVDPNTGAPVVKPAAIQAGMFGDLSKTWPIFLAAGLGVYLIYGRGGKRVRR